MNSDATRPIPSREVREYLRSAPPEPPMWQVPIAQLRRDARAWCRDVGGPPEPVAVVEDLSVGDVPVRLYRPGGRERDVLVWIHGGAWMLGDIESHDALARTLANRANCAVLSVDYRLAPEHPYPAAIEDCWAAVCWAAQAFEQVAVGGDSAGGNLAAAVALRARDAGIGLAMQLLVYPVLDCEMSLPFHQQFKTAYAGFAGRPDFGALAFEEAAYSRQTYVPDRQLRRDRDASPLRAASLRDVARAVIILAEHDILRAEGEMYASRLRQDGVPVRLYLYAGQIHGFFEMIGKMPDSRDAVEKAADAVRDALFLAHGARLSELPFEAKR